MTTNASSGASLIAAAAATIRYQDSPGSIHPHTEIRIRPTSLADQTIDAAVTAAVRALSTPDLQRRLRHTLAVGQKAATLADDLRIPAEMQEAIAVAGTLHDVGYGAELRETGMHQLDGARYLTIKGWEFRVCGLVAHHSFAIFEAARRGLLGHLLSEFPLPQADWADALDVVTCADMTTSPDGEPIDVTARLADIYDRYPSGSDVHVAITAADPWIRRAVSAVTKACAPRVQEP